MKSNLFLLILRGKKTLYISVDGQICIYLPHKTMMRQWCKCCLHFFSIIEYRRTTLVNVVYNEVHSLSPRSGWTETNLNANICSIKATVFKINKQTSRKAWQKGRCFCVLYLNLAVKIKVNIHIYLKPYILSIKKNSRICDTMSDCDSTGNQSVKWKSDLLELLHFNLIKVECHAPELVLSLVVFHTYTS